VRHPVHPDILKSIVQLGCNRSSLEREVEYAGRRSSLSPFTAAHIHHVGGAIARIPANGSALGRRSRFGATTLGGRPLPKATKDTKDTKDSCKELL
jgi:hypothetical protein